MSFLSSINTTEANLTAVNCPFLCYKFKAISLRNSLSLFDFSTPRNRKASAPTHPKNFATATQSKPNDRDFLIHFEAYLAKRDGVDMLLKFYRYATTIILASSVLPKTLPTIQRLKCFESIVGLSRKAFRLGKFVQDISALRNSHFYSKQEIFLSIIAYGGEGLCYFVEQFIWLAKSGLINGKHWRNLQKISAWVEFITYLGSTTTQSQGFEAN
ncbi:hypothetical protein SLA2020_196660 [Shorea laevis]